MKTRRLWAAAVLLLATLSQAPAGANQPEAPTWKPAQAPLLTRWARDVSPENVRPEYPRPQLVRREWLNLNGLWQFAFDDADEGHREGWSSGKDFPQRILVPFTYESALSGIGLGGEVHERVWYRRHFSVPRAWRGRSVLLNFGACDWDTTVWVNGREVGSHRGGYTPFSLDITEALRPEGEQEMVVAVFDPARGPQPKGKQLGSRGIWYTRTTGIWQTVWLEPVQPTHLAGLRLEPKPSEDLLVVTGRVARPQAGDRLYASVWREGRRVSESWGRTDDEGVASIPLPVHDPVLWSPESPALYDVVLEVRRNDRLLDRVTSYCAFRSVGQQQGRLTLNGKPLFFRGVLDQGYWPDGIYTAPTDEALRHDVEMAKALGFNLARKHVKVEDPRWYYWCDRLGLLVSQDMPSSHDLSRPEAKRQFLDEWLRVMRVLRNHPSIILWVPFNEDWGKPGEFQDEVVLRTRALDPTRPIIDASGWTQRSLTDVIDIHDYGTNLTRHGKESPDKPRVIGEFGGIGLPVPEHTWTKGWGYQQAVGPRSLSRRYSELVRQLHRTPGLSGFVYTQLTDVEQELNGLLTYDRIPKVDPARLADLTQGRPLPPLSASR